MASTSIQNDRVNESVTTYMDTACNEASNEITAPAVSSLTKCTRTKIVVSILVVFVIGVALCFYVAFKPSGDGYSDTQASAHGTAKQTGSGQERTDPDRLLLRFGAEGVLYKEIIKPYIAKQLEESDSSASEYIHNSSCLLCNGICKHPRDLKEIFICNDSITTFNCGLKRDMKNKDEGVCGGAGKYVCYTEYDEPQCKCHNDKVGELCQNETKVACKCWTSKLVIEGQDNIPHCNQTLENWTSCKRVFDHDFFKCLCTNTETLTEKLTATQTGFEEVRTDENHEKPETSQTNVTKIIVIVISCFVFILIIVVFGMLVTRWRKCLRGQHPIETQRPLLTTNTPISVNGLGNGCLQIGQNVDHMHVGAVGNTCGKQIASNGSSQNDRTMNNPDHHDLQLISTSSKPCASKKLENEENQGKDKAYHSLNDKEIMGASAGSSNKGIMTEEETAVKQRPPTNSVSIHGNTFKNCKIRIPLKKARYEDVSGSFGMDSSLESEMNHPFGQHHTTGTTMIQPGRRDGYLINGDNQPGHNNQERADGNCRPEYSRTPFGHARFQEAPAGRVEVYHEDVAMETLDKPNYPCDTSVDIDTEITEMVENNVATVSGLDRPRANNVATVSGLDRPRADRVQQIKSTRRIAKVAPRCATRVQSVRHTPGYPSGGINVSDESASCIGTSMSTGYRVAGIADIADTGDFSTASDLSEGFQNDVMNIEDTARKREAMNEQPPVHHVTPLYRSPAGDSGSHTDNRQTVGLDIDENTSEKVVAADETDVKQYVDWRYPNADEGMIDSHDSESDLKKPNEEQLMELKNVNEKFHDNKKDLNCDSRHIECTSNAAVIIPDSNENECVTVNESHVISELTDKSDGILEETAEDSSVEIDGNSLKLEINGNGNENGDWNDLEEESFEKDNNVVRDILPTQPSDDSYEIDDNVDIDAIHRENQHAQDITCRGETYDELNSVQSVYKGFTPV